MIKTRIYYIRFLLLLAVYVFYTTSLYASDSLMLNPSIKYGKLENGLTYFIKPIENGSSEININLVVKTGFYQEEKDQYQFAHVVEHLGFTAGENISLKKDFQLFDEVNIRFGDLNGYVRNNQTRYYVKNAKNNEKAINLVLSLFRDIIWNLNLNEKSVATERISVINEGSGGEYDISSILYSLQKKLIEKGAQLPNDENYMHNFKTRDLIKFYEKWYQPRHMALVIVGDIEDVDQLEQKILRDFGRRDTLSNSFSEDQTESKYLDKEPQFLKQEHPERIKDQAKSPVGMKLYFRQDVRSNEEDRERIKNELIRDLLVELLNSRLNELQQNYNTFYTVRSGFLDPPLALHFKITTQGGLRKEILKNAYQAILQVREYGFLNKEFFSSKNKLLLQHSKNDTLENSYWTNEIINYYVDNKPLLRNKIDIQKEFLNNLELEEFNLFLKEYIDSLPEDITLSAHKGDPSLNYSEEEIRSWLREIELEGVKPYSPPVIPDHLISPDVIKALNEVNTEEENIEIPGATKIILENGVTVILKPFKADNENSQNSMIRFHGFTDKGVKCFPKKDYFSAINSVNVAINSGIGDLNRFELKRFLEKRKFKWNIQPYIEAYETGIKGTTSVEELELALQMIYLYFTSPNFTIDAFDDWKKSAQLNSVYFDIPAEDLFSEVRKVLPDNEFLPQGTSAGNGIDKTDYDRAKEIYKQLFGNAEDFKFIISGNFNKKDILPVLKKYLGNLSTSDKKEFKRNPEKNLKAEPQQVPSKTFYTEEPLEKALIKIVYVRPLASSNYDWREGIKVEILRRMMAELLIRKLRIESDTGGVYMVPVGRTLIKSHNYHETFINLRCIPDHANRLILESNQVVQSLRNSLVNKVLFKNQKTAMYNNKETLRDILDKMYYQVKNDEEWVDISEKRRYINSLTREDIRQTAAKYLKGEPFVFKMLPQN